MAETSGFFDAQVIEGQYDRVYYAEQFANYFKTLVGNGVFSNPVNQLKVSSSSGLKVNVNKGKAFINGYWYDNSEIKSLTISPNNGNQNRIDSVKLRYSNVSRSITVGIYEGTTDVTQTDGRYELKLAEITVKPLVSAITEAEIKDTRQNESVCGFVKGLVELVNTEDLFSQYNAIFNSWFESIQNIVTSTQYQQMLSDITNIKNGTIIVPNATNASESTNAVTANSAKNDIIVATNKVLTFTNKVCTISNSNITANSLADVYFTTDCIEIAKTADISVETSAGKVTLTATRVPSGTITATIRVRVV